MGEEEQEDEDDGKGPPKLFTMNFVNSYGNAQLEQLSNDLKPIKFTGEISIGKQKLALLSDYQLSNAIH